MIMTIFTSTSIVSQQNTNDRNNNNYNHEFSLNLISTSSNYVIILQIHNIGQKISKKKMSGIYCRLSNSVKTLLENNLIAYTNMLH